jgi:LPPG:FO 2-phospho-L-lactate transferase
MSSSEPDPQVVLLTGGLGGARLAPCLRDVLDPGKLSIVANIGDDLTWHGLRVCPDLDSVTYALADLWDSERGWGLHDETFNVRDALTGLHAPQWFNVGDRDLALHLLRSDHLRSGRTLTDATRELSRELGVADVTVLPASDEPNETHMLLKDGRLLHFQEWYVREGAVPELSEVRLADGAASKAAIQAIEGADVVVFSPSNPITSIGAILALEGIEEAIRRVPCRIAVSPVVTGIEPNDAGARHHALARQRTLATEGFADDPSGISARYSSLAELFLLDNADADYTEEIRRAGLEPVHADLLDSPALARTLVSRFAAGSGE